MQVDHGTSSAPPFPFAFEYHLSGAFLYLDDPLEVNLLSTRDRKICHSPILYALSGLVGNAMNPWSSPAWSTMANQGEKSPWGNSLSVFGFIDRNLSYCVKRVLTTWLMQRVWLTILDVVISDGDASLSIADCVASSHDPGSALGGAGRDSSSSKDVVGAVALSSFRALVKVTKG